MRGLGEGVGPPRGAGPPQQHQQPLDALLPPLAQVVLVVPLPLVAGVAVVQEPQATQVGHQSGRGH